MNPTMSVPLLDPKNDFVFKTLFIRVPELLPALINAVRIGEQPVEILEIINPHIDPSELTGKYIILDVLARDLEGQQFDIEMQVRRFPAWGSRSCFYLSRLLSEQLRSGNDYTLLKPVIGIHLLDFDLFTAKTEEKQAVWCFEMRDALQPSVRLSRDLQLNLIELPKADRLGLNTEALRAWVNFFEHWNEEETMAAIQYEPVQRAMESLKHLSAEAETRRLAFVRERALRDEVAIRRMEREEGKAEGKAEGLAEGKAEGKAEGREEGKAEGLNDALERLMAHGLSESEARRLLNLNAPDSRSITQ
jgi:predicted transposase/invertase (TIGR01784 family)